MLFHHNHSVLRFPISGLELSVADYETLAAETLLVNAVESALEAIYGVDNVDVIAI